MLMLMPLFFGATRRVTAQHAREQFADVAQAGEGASSSWCRTHS
jgi:hypothetical protein